MFNTNSTAEYLQRAEMHEQLAGATDDLLARKMHLAMAVEYRRRAAEGDSMSIASPSSDNAELKLSIAAR